MELELTEKFYSQLPCKLARYPELGRQAIAHMVLALDPQVLELLPVETNHGLSFCLMSVGCDDQIGAWGVPVCRINYDALPRLGFEENKTQAVRFCEAARRYGFYRVVVTCQGKIWRLFDYREKKWESFAI